MTNEMWMLTWSVALNVISVALIFGALVKLVSIERGAKSALQQLQIQVAFLSGRVGLNNKDLQTATMRAADPEPAPPPEVIGGTEWNDFEETVDRISRGEIETEEIRGAR